MTLLALLHAAGAYASAFAVSPVRVQLSADAPIASLSVRNQSAAEVAIQVQVFEWSQQDGEDQQQPTDALIAAPAIFTLPAEGVQTLRVGLRQPAQEAVERSFRVLLRELPPPADQDFQGLKVALAMSIPVFVAPAAHSNESLQWQLAVDGDAVLLQARNDGNVHVQVASLTLRQQEHLLAESTQAVYLLAGQQRSWRLTTAATPIAGPLQLQWQTPRGSRTVTLALP